MHPLEGGPGRSNVVSQGLLWDYLELRMPFLNEDVYSPNDADSSERPPSFRRFSMRGEEGGWSPYSLSVTMTIVTEGRILGRLDWDWSQHRERYKACKQNQRSTNEVAPESGSVWEQHRFLLTCSNTQRVS